MAFFFSPTNWLTRNIVNTACEQMQEWFCLQLRCAGVSAETEGDKGIGRPMSRAVLLPFFFLLPAQATLIQFSLRDLGLLRRTWVLGNGRSEQGQRPRAGPQFSRRQREKERRWRWGGSFGIFFFSPGWMGDCGDSTFAALFSFENYYLRAAVGQEGKTRRWKLLGRAPPPAAGTRGAEPAESLGRRAGGAQPFAAAEAWPCPAQGEASGQGLPGASGVQF